MSPNQQAVANAIAVLLSITPDTTLGKLLNVCLAAKVEGSVQAKAQELFQNTDQLASWIDEVIGDDDNYSPEEWTALGEMNLTDVEKFLAELLPEIEALKLE